VVILQSQQIDLATELLAAHEVQDIGVVKAAAANVTEQRGLERLMHLCVSSAMICAAASLFTNGWTREAFAQLLLRPPLMNDIGAIACLAFVTAACLLSLLMMNRHTVALQQYALAFNAQQPETKSPIAPPGLVFGLKPLHVIVAFVMAWFGVLWGVPAMLAWGAFGQMAYGTTQQFRVALADRLQEISGIEPVAREGNTCTAPGCGAAIPMSAAFCSRCGRANNLASRGDF